jgi:hypothetical protein
MRRIFGVGVALLFVALVVVLWRQSQVSIAADQIAPGNTVFYIEVPHMVQTAKNLPNTAMYQIFQEPSVRRCFKQPVSAVAKDYESSWNSFLNLGCTALFFCATDRNGERWILGFQSSANSTVRIREIQNVSKRLFERDALYVSSERQDKVRLAKDTGGICFTELGAWTVLSRNADLLKDTLQNAKSDGGGLHSSKLFQECRSNMRTAYDLLLFARGGPSLNPANGIGWEYDRDRTAGGAQAIIASTTIEGSRLRDRIFTWTGVNEGSEPLKSEGLGVTSANTIGYLVSRLELSGIWRLSNQFSGDWPLAAALRDYIGETRSFGIEPQDLDHLVSGIEIVVDRDPDSESLVSAALLEIPDRTKFQQMIDRIMREKLPDSCRPASIAGVPGYIVSPNENASIVFGLLGQKLVIAWDESIFAEIVRRLRTKDPGLEQNDQFKEMERLVATPSDLFLYIDARAVFERFYDATRPMLIFGAALIPALNRYVDAIALPETDTITKHLSPIVLSRHRVANGFIDESVGPLTAYEASAFAIAGATAVGLLHQK